MTVNLTLLVLMGVLFAIGIYLLLERSLTRVLLGIILISNGVNLLLLHTAGRAGLAPIYDPEVGAEEYLDPLPQALLLTAIVIAFALVSFMLALIYRSWVLARQDELADDEEDRRIASYANVHDTEEDAELATETTEFVDETDSAGRQLLNPRLGADGFEETDAARGTGDVGAVQTDRARGDAAADGEASADQLDVTLGAGRVTGSPRQAPAAPDVDPALEPEVHPGGGPDADPDTEPGADPDTEPDAAPEAPPGTDDGAGPRDGPDQGEGGRR